ncbi:hypothetical protein LIER_34823 [Lithospermum erythrorhizon]|uniref:Uncharacterized protein n=1 Tax=Lithospermum erythrorhizon TaxID=34254 RepID=A0AAV3S3E3_LITER
MTDFLTFSHDVHEDLVHWFYKHARVTASANDEYVCLRVDGKNNVPSLEFDTIKFETIFNLKSEGFAHTKVMTWLQDMAKFDDVCDLMNNGHSFAQGDVSNAKKYVSTNFLYGVDTFALKVLNDFLFCSDSNDSHVPNSKTVVLYHLRMGMLISFIVKRWEIMACGPSTPPPPHIGNKMIRYQRLQFDDARVHLLAKWQRRLPIDNDEGQEIQGEVVDVEEEGMC